MAAPQFLRRAWQSITGALGSVAPSLQRDPKLIIWPTEPDLSRINNYKVALRMWRGEHQALWDAGRKTEDGPYIPINLLAMKARLVAHRMTGEPPSA